MRALELLLERVDLLLRERGAIALQFALESQARLGLLVVLRRGAECGDAIGRRHAGECGHAVAAHRQYAAATGADATFVVVLLVIFVLAIQVRARVEIF